MSQPSAFGQGETKVVKDSMLSVEEQEARLMLLPGSVTLGEVVQALNAVGVTPRDLIVILQAIRKAGALNAEVEIM